MAYKIPAASGGGASFSVQTGGTGNPADGATYYLSTVNVVQGFTASSAQTRLYMPKAGTITAAYGNVTVSGTLGSAQNTTIALRLNDTTNTNVTTTLTLDAISANFSNGALSTAVAAGDFIDVLMICPTWNPNPTTVRVSITFLVT